MKKPRLLDATPYPVDVWFIDAVEPRDRVRLHKFAIERLQRAPTAGDAKSLDEVTCSDALGACSTFEDSKVILIQAREGLKKVDRTITLSHEALHAAFQVFQFIENSVDAETDHPFVYFHDHLFKQLLESK